MAARTRGRVYGSHATARAADISLRQLYYWVDVLRVVRPRTRRYGRRTFRRFTTGHLRTLKRMKRLLASGYTLQTAARMVKRST